MPDVTWYGLAKAVFATSAPGTAERGLVVRTAGQVDVSDSALRDLGKVDVANLDQYTPVTPGGGAAALPVTEQGSTKTFTATVPTAMTTSGTVVAAGAAGKVTKVYSYYVQSRTDGMTFQFKDGAAGGALTALHTLNAREGVTRAITPPYYLCKTTAATILYGAITGTGTIDVDVMHWQDDTG